MNIKKTSPGNQGKKTSHGKIKKKPWKPGKDNFSWGGQWTLKNKPWKDNFSWEDKKEALETRETHITYHWLQHSVSMRNHFLITVVSRSSSSSSSPSSSSLMDQKEKLAIFKPVDWIPRQQITAILSFFGKFFITHQPLRRRCLLMTVLIWVNANDKKQWIIMIIPQVHFVKIKSFSSSN